MSAAWRKRKSVIGRPPRVAVQVSPWLVMLRHLAACCRLTQIRGNGCYCRSDTLRHRQGDINSWPNRSACRAARSPSAPGRDRRPTSYRAAAEAAGTNKSCGSAPGPETESFLPPVGTWLSAPSAGLVTPNRRRSMAPRRSCRAARPQTPSRSRVCRRPAARGST